MTLLNEKTAAYNSVEPNQLKIDGYKESIKLKGSEIYKVMNGMLALYASNIKLITENDISLLIHDIQTDYKVRFGKESAEKGNVGMEKASQVARDWVTIASACVKHGAVDMSEWSSSNQEMRYLSDRYNCYKTMGRDETDQLIAGDESHKANTQSGMRNSLKKIKDENLRDDLIKAGLLPKPEPIAEGLVMLSKEEHTMIEVIRTYLDGSDAKAVHDWMVVQTGHFSEMMMTQGTAKVQTPPKKKGKKKAA